MTFKKAFKRIRAEFLGIDPGIMRMYYRYIFRPKQNTLAYALDQKSKDQIPFYFIQIGGNDGFANDPLFKFIKSRPWNGVIIEPQKHVFKYRLKKTYRFEKKVKLENLAVADKTGTRKLYKLAMSNSRWATGLASFNREVLEKQIRTNRVRARALREGVKIPSNLDDWISFEKSRLHYCTRHND